MLTFHCGITAGPESKLVVDDLLIINVIKLLVYES
jgi:hypothetical protein